jgi:hypothetical protein
MAGIQEKSKKDRNIQDETSLTEVLELLIQYIIIKLNLQRILFLFSFLSFGAADGISAAYMIEKRGIIGEANPLIQYMYVSSGIKGVIGIKLWLVLVMLSFVWNMSKDKKNYWMISGFLFALFVTGLIATGANLMAASGLEYPESGTVITIYLFLVILLTTIGEVLDKLHL